MGKRRRGGTLHFYRYQHEEVQNSCYAWTKDNLRNAATGSDSGGQPILRLVDSSSSSSCLPTFSPGGVDLLSAAKSCLREGCERKPCDKVCLLWYYRLSWLTNFFSWVQRLSRYPLCVSGRKREWEKERESKRGANEFARLVNNSNSKSNSKSNSSRGIIYFAVKILILRRKFSQNFTLLSR